ncbi:MAG: MATE family efflux transporter [Dokdonella sp.]
MIALLPSDRSRLLAEFGATSRLALPLVLGQLSAVGMNVIDTMLAGHLSKHALGAVAVGASIWTLVLVSAIGIMMSLPPSVSQLHGAGRDSEIGPLFRQSLWLAIPLGCVLGLAVALLGPNLMLLTGVDPALNDDVGLFLGAVAFGAPALTVFFALRGLSEGLGMTRPTMYFSMLGLILLGPIGYVLMYGHFGFAPRGVLGLGIATALVLWLQCFAFAIYVARRQSYARLDLLARFDWPHWPTLAGLLHIGLPMGITLFMEASLFVAVALFIARLGTDIVASHQIALNVASVSFMVPLGIAMATTVRVGHAVGRGDYINVRHAGAVGLLLTLAVQLVSAGLMFSLPIAIATLYTRDPVVIALAAQLLILAAMFQLSDGIQVAANGALRGLKDTRVPMFITAFAYWGVGIPVGWWLAFPLGLGARGMWMGLIAGLTMSAILLTTRFWRQLDRLTMAAADATSSSAA